MRVLLVEDEVNIALPLKKALVNEGFVVDVAHDGVRGQWLATENPYDVIVLDIMLPGRNGYDVLRNIRELKIWSPVMMLTAKDGEFDQTDAFDLGADDYLTKPFSVMVLIARLRALVRRGAPERPTVLSAGDLTLDPARHLVTRGDAAIELTSREFAVLQFLLRHVDDVVSKMEILDNVWDRSYEGSENIVEVYINHLRKKVDAPFGCESLETVRGRGYRLHSVATGATPAQVTTQV
jgi:DNA-binding response OmpR family regulator